MDILMPIAASPLGDGLKRRRYRHANNRKRERDAVPLHFCASAKYSRTGAALFRSRDGTPYGESHDSSIIIIRYTTVR